ncbi:cytochrome P450 [Kibdelosporangium aridum]|uniref:Cytochrome P450 n=1 Tax=Kibdelosporangium aridum TaxID=2030 RepID=A0A428Z317_KIBAR|nr:cytochrome P450 [Kibdelosporangium aridum]RSM80080.1 cytochrome P450 [Kibdelosporangium aridum]
MNLLFDPRDPSLSADPYPHYRRLREADPVHQSPFGYWVLTRYADLDVVLRSPYVSSEFHRDKTWAKHRGGPDSPIVTSTRMWMLMLDGAAHRRIRGLMGRAFTPRAVARLRPRVQSAIDDLIDAMGEGEVDLLSQLALPLPVTVICELLGLPTTDRDQCREWTDKIAMVVDPAITPTMAEEMNAAEVEFRAYITEQLNQRRRNPSDDILSLLLAAEVDGERLTDDEIVANVLLMFNAGHETTVNLIGNGMVALLQHPDQLALLRENPSLIETGIDELARYDAPVQLAARITTADVELTSATIPAGSKVMLMYGAACRDPERYPDPDRLDLTRDGVKPIAFGGGPHYCIGAPLGRLEASMVFTALLDRYASIDLATEELQWRRNVNFRGLKQLPLKLVG